MQLILLEFRKLGPFTFTVEILLNLGVVDVWV